MGPRAWFLAAAVSGAACAGMAVVVLVAGWRRRLAEVATVGAALYTLSILVTSSAIAGAGSSGGRLTAVLAAPLGLAVAAPVLARDRFAAVLRVWPRWVAGAFGAASVGAVLLPGVAYAPGDVEVAVATGFAMWWAIALVRRQLLLFEVSRRTSTAVAAAAIAVLGSSALAGPWVAPGTAPAWLLLAADNAGLFTAAVALLVGYRSGRDVAAVVAPLVARDPVAALDLGLAPEVEAFVAALGRKDPITRDHVIRTGTSALHAAARAGLPGRTVRDVFIGALLHDIGKLVIPSAIIGKASTLTDEEFATIRTHPEQGERLLAHAPTLAGAARYVRWHHERPDGTGYPDGLRGHEIPLEVSIVSAADAWDAMTNTRQYRTAMSAERAREILLAGAGTQWRAEAVRHLLEVVDRDDLATSLPQRAGPVATEPTESTIECALEHRP